MSAEQLFWHLSWLCRRTAVAFMQRLLPLWNLDASNRFGACNREQRIFCSPFSYLRRGNKGTVRVLLLRAVTSSTQRFVSSALSLKMHKINMERLSV